MQKDAWQKIQQTLQNAIGLNVNAVGKSNLDRAVHFRMKLLKLPSIDAYDKFLHTSAAELTELVEEVVVPETWFFRNHESFSALSSILRPQWFDFTAQHPLRILSVPCSTGEEPYSIAMTLHDLGLHPSGYHIDAVDISERALAKAREGCYNKHSFRHNEGGFRERFFTESGDNYLINAKLRQSIDFLQDNLLAANFGLLRGHYHIIFCRNLLIYFDRETQTRSVNKLCNLLLSDGTLFLGHAETGDYVGTTLKRLKYARAFAYQPRTATQPARQPATPAEAGVINKMPPLPMPADLQPASVIPPNDSAPSITPTPVADLHIPEQDSPELSQIAQCANEGNLIQAEFMCNDYLYQHDTHAQAYYLLALIYQAQGRLELVEGLYRKTVYLDPDHYEALIHLAEHAERHNDKHVASQLRARSSRVLARRRKQRQG